MMKIKRQTLKKSNGKMMVLVVLVVPQIIQKLKMIPQIHPSNLAQNKTKNQKRSSELLLMKMVMIEVKAASLTTVISLKHL
jgi:hypothetical protein